MVEPKKFNFCIAEKREVVSFDYLVTCIVKISNVVYYITYMPTLERLKAVGGVWGVFPLQKMFFSEGRKMVHSAAFWI
jgi:hypothetical protein